MAIYLEQAWTRMTPGVPFSTAKRPHSKAAADAISTNVPAGGVCSLEILPSGQISVLWIWAGELTVVSKLPIQVEILEVSSRLQNLALWRGRWSCCPWHQHGSVSLMSTHVYSQYCACNPALANALGKKRRTWETWKQLLAPSFSLAQPWPPQPPGEWPVDGRSISPSLTFSM